MMDLMGDLLKIADQGIKVGVVGESGGTNKSLLLI